MQKKQRRGLSSTRRILFTFIAVIAVPALFLIALELGLRAAGFGYPTRFFIPKTINGKTWLVQNDQFGLRFFPSALVRRPLPTMIARHKSEHAVRIFVFGESAAMGDPDPAFSFGRILGELLRQRFPGTQFEVVNVAFTAINSHVILPIARECASLEGDLWVIYMGNNEMMGPFGAGTIFGQRTPSLGMIRASLALKQTRIGQLVALLAERARTSDEPNVRWEGLKMFDQVRVAPGDKSRSRVYTNFQRNLEDILKTAERAHVPVLLSTVASNLRDCAPFASVHNSSLSDDRRQAWGALAREGGALQSSGNAADALVRFEGARKLDPSYAEVEFRIGLCHLALGNILKAYESFTRARDLDALPFRTDTGLNGILNGLVLKQGAAAPSFVAAEAKLNASATNQIPGSEFFYDHVHLTFSGNYELALAMAEQARTRLPQGVALRDTGAWADLDACGAALAWTPLSEAACYQSMLARTAEAPFTNQLTHRAVTAYYRAKLNQLAPQNRETIAQAREMAAKAVARSPGDFYVREELARALTAAGEMEAAIAEWEHARDLLPLSAAPYFELGRLFEKTGKNAEAKMNLAHALELQPQSAEVLAELAHVSIAEGNFTQALEQTATAIELNPNVLEAWIARALAQEKLGQTNNAIQTLKRVAAEKPTVPSVRTAAARLLMVDRKFDEAAEQYRHLVELQPRNPGAYMDLANALAAGNHRREATTNLQRAVELKPNFWQAHYLLGVELAMQNRLEEAAAEFSEVIRAQPNYPLAHLNLGVALAQQGRMTEATQQFQETLRLDPQNAKAQRYITAIETGQSLSPLLP